MEPAIDSADPSHLLALLERHFGYNEFRPGQETIIANALSGRHGLVVMPTGGGKSLCYQLPALAMGGLTLVVSPLIALMKDQVDGLRANGVSAAFINSSLDSRAVVEVERKAQAGEISLLYVAPERASLPGFRRLLGRLDLRLIAIDEAHCISEWGHDFRPDYRALSDLRALFPTVPVMALTATATEHVRDDIVNQLDLGDCPRFVSGFDRANLTYRAEPKSNAWQTLLDILGERRGQAGIIYCLSRRETEEVAAGLTAAGHPAVAYHAGLDADTRRQTQERFIDGDIPLVAATIAFGMGIDKPDIRLVAHYSLPKSIEGYYQETGRAGRDGLPSECVLFFSEGDRARQEFFIRQMSGDARRAAERQLQRMVDYGRLRSCRRKYLLDYFGEAMDGDSCGNCDSCLHQPPTVDVTIVAQKILSAVVRTGERFGIAHVSDVLLGRNGQRVRELGHDSLSVYGIVDDYHRDQLRDIANGLLERGLLARSDGQFPTLGVTTAGREWLRSRQTLALSLRDDSHQPKREKTRNRSVVDALTEHDATLFDQLRALRRRLADEQGVPAFVVFSDATLRELAAVKPANRQAMRRVSGVGPTKLERYGSDFLSVIREYVSSAPAESGADHNHNSGDSGSRGKGPSDDIRREHSRAYEPWNDEDTATLKRMYDAGASIRDIAGALGRQPSAIRTRLNRPPNDGVSQRLGPTHTITLQLLQQGLTIAQVAEHRALSQGVVVEHIERLVEAGHPLDLNPLMPDMERVETIQAALRAAADQRLRPVKELLGDDYSYEEIRLARLAFNEQNYRGE